MVCVVCVVCIWLCGNWKEISGVAIKQYRVRNAKYESTDEERQKNLKFITNNPWDRPKGDDDQSKNIENDDDRPKRTENHDDCPKRTGNDDDRPKCNENDDNRPKLTENAKH